MNRTATLTAFVALLLGVSAPASAVDQRRELTSNAIDKCQAFTPGVTNTIRNRVIGAENVGTAPVTIACTFELEEVASDGQPEIREISLEFLNGAAAPVEITCVSRIGKFNIVGGPAAQITASTEVDAGKIGTVQFDNINDFDVAVGLTCTLPSKAILTHTRIVYNAGNGLP